MSTTVREEYEVGDLDPAGVLEAAAEAEQAERRAAFRKLELAAHWADLHPATADTGVETSGGAALLADESLGGDGTPAVAAFTPEPFALAWACPLALGRSSSPTPSTCATGSHSCGNESPLRRAGLAGPTRRPPDPPPAKAARSGSTNRSPTAAPAAP